MNVYACVTFTKLEYRTFPLLPKVYCLQMGFWGFFFKFNINNNHAIIMKIKEKFVYNLICVLGLFFF